MILAEDQTTEGGVVDPGAIPGRGIAGTTTAEVGGAVGGTGGGAEKGDGVDHLLQPKTEVKGHPRETGSRFVRRPHLCISKLPSFDT